MRFLTVFRLGLRRARRHAALVLLVYLSSLVPSLLLLTLLSGHLQPDLDRSLFAERLLQGDSYPPWSDFLASRSAELKPLMESLAPRWLLVTVLQILVAAGIVEVLLERTGRREHPFLNGIGRHGWRFLRSAGVFTLIAGPVLLLLRLGTSAAFGGGDDRLQVIGWGVFALLAALIYALLDLAYDLSRIAAAAHDEGRMAVGFFRSLGFILRHLGVLLSFYALFRLVMLALPLGYLAIRQAWWITDLTGVILLLGLQQLLFVLRTFFLVGLWGAEISYYQGVGEPRWCGGPSWWARRRARRALLASQG